LALTDRKTTKMTHFSVTSSSIAYTAGVHEYGSASISLHVDMGYSTVTLQPSTQTELTEELPNALTQSW